MWICLYELWFEPPSGQRGGGGQTCTLEMIVKGSNVRDKQLRNLSVHYELPGE